MADKYYHTKATVARQAEVLTANGLVCHSFWKGDGNEEFKGMFVNYHQKHDLEQFFSTHFEILLMEEYAEFEEADSFLLIAKKN